ncbi:MAG: DUF2905 domain-containing protein [Methyloceanibacter sp.]|uniref:DUF2905 domain-containing protein n=1 Tax=Methyloceanibacter sp. TaxID=1965321 RepID=UPI003D9BC84F
MSYWLGLLLLVGLLGLFIYLSLQYGLGRLPGDVVIARENFLFYLPITTAIIVSVLLSLAFWLFGR